VSAFDYFFDFPEDYELGDGGEFDLDGMMSSIPNNTQDDHAPLIVTPDVWAPPPTSLKDEQLQELQLNALSRYPVNYMLPPVTTMAPSPLPPSSSRPLPPPPAFSKSTSEGSASSGGSSSSRKRHMDVQDDNKTYASLMERRHLAESTEREKRMRAFGYSNGKNRLKLDFISFGVPGVSKQGFGRKNGIVPDGLHGTNEVYNEKWEFQILHRKDPNTNTVCLEWWIRNLASKHVTSRLETAHDAHVRRTQGKTICNHVVREALDQRADELEAAIITVADVPLRVANLQSRAKALRPRRCLIGLLFFGLLHEAVQQHMLLLDGAQHEHSHEDDNVEEDDESFA
jgi:hypothetical protein